MTLAFFMSLFLLLRSAAHFSHSFMQRAAFSQLLSEPHIPGSSSPSNASPMYSLRQQKNLKSASLNTPSLSDRKMSARKHHSGLTVGGQVTS